MVHLPLGGSVGVDVHKALPGSDRYRGWWVDPRIGSKVVFARNVDVLSSDSIGITFEAPSGGTIENDWILYLTDINVEA